MSDRQEKAPAFQFYPRDYLSDARVLAMSYEERGVYMHLLCVCWNEHGELPADVGALARIVGWQRARFDKAWRAIEPCFERRGESYHHPRLDKEREKQEARRLAMSENGKRGGRPRKASLGETESRGFSEAKPTESSSSSSSSSASASPSLQLQPESYPAAFEEAWSAYPKRGGGNPKRAAFKAWNARVNDGVPVEVLQAAAVGYASAIRAAKKEGTEYVLQGATFFGPNERWKEYVGADSVDAVRVRAAEQWEFYKARGMTTTIHAAEWWDEAIPAAAAALGVTPEAFREELKKVRPWEVAKVAQSAEWAVGEVLRRLAA